MYQTRYDLILFEEDIRYKLEEHPVDSFKVISGYDEKRKIPNRKIYSWEQAAKICFGINGYLPFFIARQDMETLIAIIKLTSYLPPLEALFIGLKQFKVIFSAAEFLVVINEKALFRAASRTQCSAQPIE